MLHFIFIPCLHRCSN